ncbi:MAG: ATP-dependent DNA helicase RecG [Chloroflexota bacterium]|nr:ATP-dependent DNA helicase RecG [Chloroflexota bacterium]
MEASKKANKLKILASILSQEYQLGLNDQSVELGLDNFIQNSYKDIDWIFNVYPMKSRNYKNLGIGERHIWVKNLLSKIAYEIKIIEEKITHEILLKNLPLETPLEQLPFMDKRHVIRFTNLGIFNLGDLILHFPFRYEDYTKIKNVNSLIENENATIVGTITKKLLIRKMNAPQIIVTDNTGSITATFFNMAFLVKKFKVGQKIALAGMIKKFRNSLQFNNPEYELFTNNVKRFDYLQPIYHSTEKLSQEVIKTRISSAIKANALDKFEDFIPDEVLIRNDLFSMKDSIKKLHFARSQNEKEKASRSFAFHEVFENQISVKYRKKQREKNISSYSFTSFEKNYQTICKFLPFELTKDQKICVVEIEKDLSSNLPMARLLQGEVGSGKTIIALIALLCTAMEKKQGILLAPTEVLAEQHFINLSNLVGAKIEFGNEDNIRICNINNRIKIALLTGSLNQQIKEKTRSMILNNELDIIIGTHALLHEDATKNLSGLIVIDEQQRFGVDQRNLLLKRKPIPNLLAMSATPIPRTLSMTLYGDLSLSTIKTMPNRKRDVETYWMRNAQFDEITTDIEKELKSGSQVFYVCPHIDTSEKIEVASVSQEFERLKISKLSNYKIMLLHGRMNIDEKQKIMEKLRKGEIDILVTTPIIEVGVDIPNATLIVINSAERFGISQLHQLRGRVGRGEKESKCIIVSSDEINELTAKRMEAVVKSNDGFKLSEEDLKIRGPGEFDKTKQSGWSSEYKIADPLDFDLIKLVNEEAESIINLDPSLNSYSKIKKILKNSSTADINLG